MRHDKKLLPLVRVVIMVVTVVSMYVCILSLCIVLNTTRSN